LLDARGDLVALVGWSDEISAGWRLLRVFKE
jgi:hypothetical protein